MSRGTRIVIPVDEQRVREILHQELAPFVAAYATLHKAAHDYFNATTDRTARLAAEPLRVALAHRPTTITEKEV